MIKSYDKIVYMPIDSIIPYENNARNNEEAIEALVKAIPVMGFNVPVVIDKDNVIVKGHSRVEALKRLGVDLVPCIVIDGSPEEIAEERLVDNKLSEISVWDEEKLKYELREMTIDLGKFDIKLPQIKSEVGFVPEVSKKEVEMARQALTGKDRQTPFERKTLMEVKCTNCGETFFADVAEVQKYGT